MNQFQQVSLDMYKPHHLEGLRRFKLPKEQAQFTAMPAEMLEESPGRFPVVILAGGEPVGFFVLHASDRVKDYTDNRKALLLTAFSIDHSMQGRGYAKEALELLAEFVHRELPGRDEVVLAVNGKNIAAQRLYVKTGFKDTGRRRTGSLGEQWILSLALT